MLVELVNKFLLAHHHPFLFPLVGAVLLLQAAAPILSCVSLAASYFSGKKGMVGRRAPSPLTTSLSFRRRLTSAFDAWELSGCGPLGQACPVMHQFT